MYNINFTEEGLLRKILGEAIQKTGDLHKPGTFLKARSDPKRSLTKLEAYLSHCGYCTANFLTCLAKIEQIKVFISDGTPTSKMKKTNVNGYHVLLYHIENFIIRTQGLLERVMILIDAVLYLGNDSQFICYNLIKNNSHIKKLKLDIDLKQFKKISQKYLHSRNRIIHEQDYITDDLRELEFWYLIYDNEIKEGNDSLRDLSFMKKDIRFNERKIRAKWENKVLTFISDINPVIANILNKMELSYESYKINFESV